MSTGRESLFASLRRLHKQASVSPRPWSLIWNEGPAVNFTTGKPAGTCMRPETIRIIDAETRLLFARESAPEQTLKPEDMQLVVEAVNAVPLLLAEIDRLSRLELLAIALEDDERHGNLTGRAEDAFYRWKAEEVDFDTLYEDKENR